MQKILERKDIFRFLEKRKLLNQYKKAKQYLLSGNFLKVKFKLKQPRKHGIWYFRINKQFRALSYFDQEGDLIVFKIDNHQ